MSATAIRPRSAIEIVDAAFALFRANFATMAVIGLAASVPFVVMIALFFGAFPRGAFTPTAATNLGFTAAALVPIVLALVALFVFWFAVVDGAMTYAAAEAYHGNRPSPAEAIRNALSKGLSLIGGNVLRMVTIAGGAVAIGLLATLASTFLGPVVGALFGLLMIGVIATLVARTFAITSVIVIERRSAVEGLSRSFSLSRQATLRIIGVGFLCLCIYWVAQIAGMVVVNVVVGAILRSPIVAAVLGNVVAMLVYPFLNIALMVLYFDQRVRKEGYDLDVLADLTPAAPLPAQP